MVDSASGAQLVSKPPASRDAMDEVIRSSRYHHHHHRTHTHPRCLTRPHEREKHAENGACCRAGKSREMARGEVAPLKLMADYAKTFSAKLDSSIHRYVRNGSRFLFLFFYKCFFLMYARYRKNEKKTRNKLMVFVIPFPVLPAGEMMLMMMMIMMIMGVCASRIPQPPLPPSPTRRSCALTSIPIYVQ
ncbi:hypothetical protein LX32DRAFT_386357 [Colletotrichum zoysiae]|uniref:Uncharacterized protein n=1 Tax=Colletotrichum zoysiae TaxID=1216348 RepID=A0AAD9HI66_9PEZI|nr:hypothetical protein LX32DRAFT_386357 [Colletotrichum zoysiae]